MSLLRNDIFMDDVLQFALKNGIIDLSYIQDQYDMSKKKDLLNKHKWAISQGKDGYWRTYLLDKHCKNGRRMIKKHTKKEVEDEVIEYYKQQTEKPKTFDDAYHKWRLFKDEMISDNSVSKYNTDYNRYFKGTIFAKTDITTITEEDIQVFIVKTVKQKQLCKKACKTLFGYISNTCKSAMIHKVIENNPTENLQASQFYKYCTEIEKTQEQKLVSDKDMELLYQRFYEDYKKQPEYIPTYAVHMATLTGMRVGEIAALKWENITDDYIIINMSEKYNRITKEYFIDSTKNQKDRIFPLTDELRSLLFTVKKVEMQNGFLSEWVFSNRSGRIHASVISSCSKNKCRQIGISEKGIHAYRRTINSKMRCNGVSSVVAASLLGHSPEVNQKYYTFDVSTIKEKTDIVSNITKNMPIAK